MAILYSGPLYVSQLTVLQYGIADRFIYCQLHWQFGIADRLYSEGYNGKFGIGDCFIF
jgi:hypothetical protein